MNSQHLLTLFSPYKLGSLTLKNRFVMAAMTRTRADPKTGVANDLHVEYYSQRAGAGLILTECSPISPIAQGFLGAAGLWTEEQVEGWKKVTDAVHEKGSLIFNQIWHSGRANYPSLTGHQNIAPSPIPLTADRMGHKAQVPKEMTKEDIQQVIDEFRQGAINAKRAGFDGLELHGANGYLIDQFLRTSTNQRKDDYGGSAENRSRFPLQVIDALIEVYGADRVGIKLSPVNRFQEMYDENPLETYSYLLKELDKKGIAFVELVETDNMFVTPEDTRKKPSEQIPEVAKALRPFFNGTIIINNNITPDNAAKAIDEGYANLVSHAKNWISNPDYTDRVKNSWEITPVDFTTAYGNTRKGYSDYPYYNQSQL